MFARALVLVGAVAGTMAAITGQERCNQIMCIKGLREDGTDTFSIRPVEDIPGEKFGWAGLGFGMQMVGSDVVIMWPNEDGSVTLSQRHASGHHMPEFASEPPRTAELVENPLQTFANSSMTGFTFTIASPSTRTSTNSTPTPLIWAMSRTNPKNSAGTATLIQHTWRGVELLDMDAPYDGSVITERALFPVHGVTYKENGRAAFILIAHVVCGCLAAMVVLPGGVVVPRITRGLTTSRWWFHFHAINQGLTALALVSAAFALALQFGGELNTRHRKAGCALFGLTIFQTILGVFSHWFKPGYRLRKVTFETKRGRGPSNFLHVVFGIICVAVGWGAAWTGVTSEWPERGHGATAMGWRYGWGVIVMLWLIAYIVGIIFFLPRQLRIESRQRNVDRKVENHDVYRSSAVALANEYYMEQRRAEDPTQSESEYKHEYVSRHTHRESHTSAASLPTDYPLSVPRSYNSHSGHIAGQGLDTRDFKRASAVPSALSGMTGTTGLSRITSSDSGDASLPPLGLGISRPAFLHSHSASNSGISYAGSTTTFNSDGRTTPSNMRSDRSPASKYTPTCAPFGPPKPPSPCSPLDTGLDGAFFAAKERDQRENTYELPPIVFDPPLTKPSNKLPWAGQINALAKRPPGVPPK